MKKSILLAIVAIFIMIPLASFAKTAISDSELGSVTAQEGVTIEFVNLTLNNVSLTSFAWGDSGGFTGYTGAGWVGLGNVTINGDLVVMNGPMVIDVGTNGTTRVNIALPTISLGGTAGVNVTASIKLDSTSALSGANATAGVLDIQGLKGQITGSLQVYAH
ncbi:MAG: hypothetical protein APR62_09685 [Smithella sp. SDB]|nr:MAG: hypothetical protein APR62_09685 [Smithella sp. SDB]